jgi:PAS domain S-box-containing protein/putative nucleotidyltransferase with HDIG domain
MQGLSRDLGFEALAESLPHAVWVRGPDGAMEYVNAKYTEFVGQDGEWALGWAWLDLVHPEDLAEASAAWERARADGVAYKSDLRVRAANGAYRWVASRGSPMRGPDGTILAWVGTVTDIDDQKGQERRLRRSQRELAATAALLDALQTAAPVGLAFVDRQFRKLRVNQALAQLTGLPVEDQLGRPASEITPDLWPQLEPIYRSVLSTGKPVLDVEVTRSNTSAPGGTSHCLSSFYPVRVDTEVVGVGVVVVDITERRRVEGLLAANLDALVHTIATTVEVRDPYTAGHQTRVARLAVAIAEELDLDDSDVQGIATAAAIHDIGKIGVPAEILSKPGRLSPAEFEIIKQHSQQGHDIVARIAFPWPVAQMILQHHERLDGSGYPDGISGEQILAGARIIAVADVVEAMSSHRPYRPAIGTEAALAEIERQRGKQLDADVVNACIRLFREQAFDINWQAPTSNIHG